MDKLLDIKSYRSLLCLNGLLPDLTFFVGKLPIVAADGAANQLMAKAIRPDITIGDLDSLSPSLHAQLNVVEHYDQDFSDFQKALAFLKEKKFLPAVVTGINGGMLDHILNNVNIFLENDNLLLYDPPILGFVLKSQEEKNIFLPLHTKISLLGLPAAMLSSQGLQWELSHFSLAFPGKTSCFNRTVTQEINLCNHSGAVLVLIGGENNFNEKLIEFLQTK